MKQFFRIGSCAAVVLLAGCEGRLVEQVGAFSITTTYTLNLSSPETYIDLITGQDLQDALELDNTPRTIKSVDIEGLSGDFDINNDQSSSASAILYSAFMETVSGGRTLVATEKRISQPLLGWGAIEVASVGALSSAGIGALEQRLNAALGDGADLPIALGVEASTEGGPFVATLRVTLWGSIVYESCEEVPNNPLIPFENERPCVTEGF